MYLPVSGEKVPLRTPDSAGIEIFPVRTLGDRASYEVDLDTSLDNSDIHSDHTLFSAAAALSASQLGPAGIFSAYSLKYWVPYGELKHSEDQNRGSVGQFK